MRVRLMGEFQILDEAGFDRTPRGAKARGLVALLCRTPGYRRPRRWLEARLWSDRGAEQASGSLRQALTELRRALGPQAGHLASDRDCIALTGVTTDMDHEPAKACLALEQGREFLEGLDVMDPAFAAWLAEERCRVEAMLRMASTKDQRSEVPITVRLPLLPQGIDPADAARDLGAAIARLAAEYLLRDLADRGLDGHPLPQSLNLQLESAWRADHAQLRIRLVPQENWQTLWSQRLAARRTVDQPALVVETVEAA